MGIVLDTPVVIDLLRGRVADDSALSIARDPVMIWIATIHEVYVGLRDGEGDLTEAVFNSFAIVPFGAAEARLTGAWWRRYGVPLLTGHIKHFPMPELQTESWPARGAVG